MPKSTKKPQNLQEDPAVIAAKVNRSGTIRNGLIAGAAAVLVAIIGLMNRSCDQPANKEKLVIKVLDKKTGNSIGGAKISLEGNDIPPINTTDSNGIISFPISDPKKELRIRIEADGYEKDFNLRITPANIMGVQEVRLTPVPVASPTATAPVAGLSPTPAAKPTPPTIPINPGNNRLFIRGMVMDESGATLSGVRITIAGQGAATTDAAGNFQIPVAVARGRLIDLNISKEGFRTKTLEEPASEDPIKIVLRR
jgi:hypothetical protein